MTYYTAFLVDEDFDNDIVRGVLRREPLIDLVRVQDEGLSGRHDRVVLEWAAQTGRILLTHDVSTMKAYAYERVAKGLPMPGVFVVSQSIPISAAIDAICLIAVCSLENEWAGQVRHLPIK